MVEFIEKDYNLNNFKRIMASYIENDNEINIIGNDVLKEALKNELFQSILKDIVNSLLNAKEIDYLNLLNKSIGITFGLDEQIQKIYQYLKNNSEKYTNVLINLKLFNMLNDSNYYTPIFNSTYGELTSVNNLFTKVGTIYGLNVWTYSLFNWDSTRICFFDKIYMNTLDIVETKNDKKISFEIEYDYLVNNSKLLNIIFEKDTKIYKEYISFNRDFIIDKIIN